MLRVLGYFFSTTGRTARPGMWGITVLVFFVAFLVSNLGQQGVDTRALQGVQLVLAWPFFVAAPIRRFHDMGRPWWWVLVFLLGMLVSFLFLLLDLTVTAGQLGQSAFAALLDQETFNQALAEYNAAGPDEELEPVGAMGLGGVSLFGIFFLIFLGWLHLVPGNRSTNEYGPVPGQANTRLEEPHADAHLDARPVAHDGRGDPRQMAETGRRLGQLR